MWLLSPPRLVYRICGRLLAAARTFAAFCWIVLTLLALWAPGTCSASGKSYSAVSRQPIVAYLWEQEGTVADLDGDGRPDLVTVSTQSWGPKGRLYRIELDLTSSISPSFLSVFAEEGGLRIVPRDVDGDHDLDFVITNAWSLAPVGVWINDGRGRFTQGDPTAYPRSIWTEYPEVLSHAPKDKLKVTVSQKYRWIAFPRKSHFFDRPLFKRLFLLTPTNPSSIAISELQPRAPPVPPIPTN